MKPMSLWLTIAIISFAVGPVISSASENDTAENHNYNDYNNQAEEQDEDFPFEKQETILLSGDCTDYTDLTGMALPIEIGSSTVGATNDYYLNGIEPTCSPGVWKEASATAGPDVTYKWTAPYNGSFTISLCEADFDVCLMLFRFTCPAEPVFPNDWICGSDDACETGAQLRYVTLSAGEEIQIVVDGTGGVSGNFVLKIFETLVDDLDWFLTDQMEVFNVPGVAASIVQNGQITWTGNYGFANIEDHIPVTDTTLFTTASISKTIMVAAIMQLWEDGLLGLDDDVNDHLPFNVRNPRPPHSLVPITIRSLLSHTSSINDCWPTMLPLRTWGADSPIPLGGYLEDYLTPAGLYFDTTCNFNNWAPETAHDYCNNAAALAGYIVERVNPDLLSFGDYCKAYVFDPLGMDNSGWFLAEIDTSNLAMPYYWDGNDFVPHGHYGHPWYPAGSLRSSTAELSRHLIAFMQYGQIDGTRILDSTTVDLMRSIQYPSINDRGLIWMWRYWGLRWVVGHGGSYPGVRTRMYFYPPENTGAIVLTNGESSTFASIAVKNLLEHAAGPSGLIVGVIKDQNEVPVEHAYSKVIGWTRWDYSEPNGDYYVDGLITGTYDVRFTHPHHEEILMENISVTTGETTYVDITMQPSFCDHTVGDINGSISYNGLDITYGVSFFKGGPEPSCPDCLVGDCNSWYYCGDVNGSCTYNGLDITYGVAYFKGGAAPVPCVDCPPAN